VKRKGSGALSAWTEKHSLVFSPANSNLNAQGVHQSF